MNKICCILLIKLSLNRFRIWSPKSQFKVQNLNSGVTVIESFVCLCVCMHCMLMGWSPRSDESNPFLYYSWLLGEVLISFLQYLHLPPPPPVKKHSECMVCSSQSHSPYFSVFSQFFLFWKIKRGLWDHLAVCLSHPKMLGSGSENIFLQQQIYMQQ
jgi:hypothetical protein